MKNLIFKSLYGIALLSLFACSDDASTPSGGGGTNSGGGTGGGGTGGGGTGNYSGVYSGTQVNTYTEKGTTNVLLVDTTAESYTISGSGTSYQLQYDDNGTVYSLNLTMNGSNFTAVGAANDPWFAGETYTGSFSGDRLSMSYNGEDSDQGIDYTYNSVFVGNRPASGGGGTGGGGGSSSNSLSVSGEDVGSFNSASCGSAFSANYGTSTADWLLEIETAYDCADPNFYIGNYTVEEYDQNNAPSTTGCFIRLYKSDANNGTDLLEVFSTNSSGSVTSSSVNGKIRFSGSNVQLTDGSVTKTISFSITAQ